MFRFLSLTRERPQQDSLQTPRRTRLPASTFDLNRLPNELITEVMTKMSPRDLASMERTSTTMHALATPAWRALYGPHVPHRRIARGESYKALFVEREMLHDPFARPYLHSTAIATATFFAYSALHERLWHITEAQMKHAPEWFVDQLVLETDTDLVFGHGASRVPDLFLALCQSDKMHDARLYHEVVALALMAANRMREARPYRCALQGADGRHSARHYMHLARYADEALWPTLSWRDADAPLRAQSLVIAAAAGQTGQALALLALGTPTNASYLTRTAARAAAANNQVHMLKVLHAHGADIGLHAPTDAPPADPQSAAAIVRPIIDAICTDSVQAAGYLVEQGVDIDLTERTDTSQLYWLDAPRTAWALALARGNLSMIATLCYALPPAHLSVAHSTLRLAPLFDWAASRVLSPSFAENMLQMLLRQHRIDVHAKDIRGRTAMHLAAEKGLLDLVRILCAHGASLQNDFGAIICSPLELAECGRHEETAQFIAAKLGQTRDKAFFNNKTRLLNDIMALRREELCQVAASLIFAHDIGLGPNTTPESLLAYVTTKYDAYNIHQQLIDGAMPLWSFESMLKHRACPDQLPQEQKTADAFDAAIETWLSQRPARNTGRIVSADELTEAEQRVRRLADQLRPDIRMGLEDIQHVSRLIANTTTAAELAELEAYVHTDAFVAYFANQIVFDRAISRVLEQFHRRLVGHLRGH